jgi:hypothetical protein
MMVRTCHEIVDRYHTIFVTVNQLIMVAGRIGERESESVVVTVAEV